LQECEGNGLLECSAMWFGRQVTAISVRVFWDVMLCSLVCR